MTTRNVTKSFITEEDMVLGVGSVTQVRGVSRELSKVSFTKVVASTADLLTLTGVLEVRVQDGDLYKYVTGGTFTTTATTIVPTGGDGTEAWVRTFTIDKYVSTLADLRAAYTAEGQTIHIKGHTTEGVGGGEFRIISAAEASTKGYTDSDVTPLLTNGKYAECLDVINKGYVTPQQFGAVDASTDRAAIQASWDYASANGLDAVVPKPPGRSYYDIPGPVFLRSFINYYISGQIRNTEAYPGQTYGDTFVVSPGAFDNLRYNGLTYDTATSITAGERTIQLDSGGGRYSVGDTVIVRDSASINVGYSTGSDYMRFNVVTNVSGNELTLRYEHDKSVVDLAISPTDGEIDYLPLTNIPQESCYVLRDANVYGMNIYSDHFWSASTAALNCTFNNTRIEYSTALWYGNSFQRCEINGVSGTFVRECVELAASSFMTRINGLIADLVEGQSSGDRNTILYSENTEDCHINDFRINANSRTGFTPVIALGTCFNCSATRGTVYVEGSRGSMVSYSEGRYVATDSYGNAVDSVDFYTKESAILIEMVNSDFGDIRSARLSNSNFYGPSPEGAIIGRLSMSDSVLENNRFEQFGALQISDEAENTTIRGNHIPDGFAALPGADYEEALAKNVVQGNFTTRANNIRAASFTNIARKSVTTTTPNAVAFSRDLSAPSFSAAQPGRIGIKLSGIGFASSANVELWIAGTKVADLSGALTSFQVEVSSYATETSFSNHITISLPTGTTTTRVNSSGINCTTTDYTIQVRAWVAVGGDSVTIDSFEVHADPLI